jgi:gliding motility-associated-like protein
VIETILFNSSWFIEVKSVTCDPALSGVFIHSYVTHTGCDSVIAESVELLASDSTFVVNSTCAPADTGAVIVTLENGNGCDSIIYIITTLLPEDTCLRNDLVRSVFVPNVFSPNGDGINDDFFVQMNPALEARVRFLRVFDRWGELVSAKYDFQPNNPVDGWDGTLSGKKLEPGVFVWIAQLEYSDGNIEVLRGDVTLVR